MERMRQFNNVDGDATSFPGHSAKIANTSNWQFRAPDVPLTPWNGPRVPQGQGFPQAPSQCQWAPSSENATPSQTEMAACAVDKQTATPRTNQVTTQHILEQMLLELDRAPLITFTSLDAPPPCLTTQHITPTPPLHAPCHINTLTNHTQNAPATHGHGGQGHYYNSAGTGVFRHPPFISSACQYDLGGRHHDLGGRHRDIVNRQESRVRHSAMMSQGVSMPTCDRPMVAPAAKVLSMTDAPSLMTRSLLELSRLVDNPPCHEGRVGPVAGPSVHSVRVSNIQSSQKLEKNCLVKKPAGIKREGLLPTHPTPTGVQIPPPPCGKLKDTAVSAAVSLAALSGPVNQDTHNDSRFKLTTVHGSVYIDRQVVTLMNIDDTGRFTRSPVIILERLQVHEHKVKTRSCQHSNKRRRVKPLRLLSYVGDSDSDGDDDSSASDYVPSECDRYSHNEDREDSDGSILDPRDLEPELDSDFLETSSDSVDFSTCDDSDNDRCSDTGDNNGDDDRMSCDDDSDTKKNGDPTEKS